MFIKICRYATRITDKKEHVHDAILVICKEPNMTMTATVHNLKLTNTDNYLVYRPAMDGANPQGRMTNTEASSNWHSSQSLQDPNHEYSFHIIWRDVIIKPWMNT